MSANLRLVSSEDTVAIRQVSDEVSSMAYPEKYGVEVELLAPAGLDRRMLARALASKLGGLVEPFFHLDSEPSRVQGKPVFYHLTQAFKVVSLSGEVLLQCLDDITLQKGLEKTAKPKAGWYRILSDDIRLLRLIHRHTNPTDPIEHSLDGTAALFGVEADATAGGVYRVADEAGVSVALAAPLPGERERACEIVTAPLAADDTSTLLMYLETAKEMGFTIPEEGATHIHFDGAFFANPSMFLKVARYLHQYRLVLRRMMGTNLNCQRIGDWSQDFLDLIKTDELLELEWSACQTRVAEAGLTKYCDFNLRNLIFNVQDKHTLEVRMLPASLNSDDLYRMLRCFNEIFSYLQSLDKFDYQGFMEPTHENAVALLKVLNLTDDDNVKLLAAFEK